jgi:hypothetical protein
MKYLLQDYSELASNHCFYPVRALTTPLISAARIHKTMPGTIIASLQPHPVSPVPCPLQSKACN